MILVWASLKLCRGGYGLVQLQISLEGYKPKYTTSVILILFIFALGNNPVFLFLWFCNRSVSYIKYKNLLINPFPNKPSALRDCSTSLLKTLWEKGEIARYEQFLLFPTVFFYPVGELSAIFIKFKIVVCKLFQFGRV